MPERDSSIWGADCTFIIYRNTGICFQKRSTNIRGLSIVWKERVTVPIPGIRKNGKVILSAGWPEEPENAPQEGTDAYEEYEQNLKEKTHINEINALAHAGNTDPEQFQWMPAKPVYLFANPNGIADLYPSAPAGDKEKGYYLKILSHEHKVGSDGTEGHEADMQYVALPEVEANMNLRLFSVISMHGHVAMTAHWMIVPWEAGGGDVEFN